MAKRDTKLILAVRSLQLGEVRKMLAKGADPNEADKDGFSPLILASFRGKTLAAKIAFSLLDHGADPKYRMPNKMSALEFSMKYGPEKLIIRLLDAGLPIDGVRGLTFTPIMEACRHGNLENLKLLIKHGAKTNVKCRSGWAKGMSLIKIAEHEDRKKMAAYLASLKMD